MGLKNFEELYLAFCLNQVDNVHGQNLIVKLSTNQIVILWNELQNQSENNLHSQVLYMALV